MTNIQRYRASDLPELFEKISQNAIGMDNYFDRFFDLSAGKPTYPPYNLVNVSNHESRLEIALAGFKKNEIKVYTEYGKLYVEGNVVKDDDKTPAENFEFIHRGLAKRSFTRTWSLADDVEIQHVDYDNGLLTVLLGKIIPEHHARKDYL